MLVARALPASLGASSKVGLLFRDRPSDFDLDLDVLVLDRFSQAPILWNEGAVAEYNVWVWQ
jgi:hypothetical protein